MEDFHETILQMTDQNNRRKCIDVFNDYVRGIENKDKLLAEIKALKLIRAVMIITMKLLRMHKTLDYRAMVLGHSCFPLLKNKAKSQYIFNCQSNFKISTLCGFRRKIKTITDLPKLRASTAYFIKSKPKLWTAFNVTSYEDIDEKVQKLFFENGKRFINGIL